MSVVPVPVQEVLATVSAPPMGEKPVEAAPEAAAPAPAQAPDNLAKHFAALSKKEKMLFREREALKAERAQIQAERARIAEIEAKYGSKPATPREALERYGYDYKAATEFELNDGSPTAEFLARQAQEQIQQLRNEQAERDKRVAQEAAQRAEAEKAEVIQEFRSEIQEFVSEKADDYELIKFNQAEDVVFETIEAHYQKTGRLLSIPEAANMVEKFLEKRMDDLKSTKKFAKTREGSPEKTLPEAGFRQSEPAPKRTISNSVTASTPSLMKSARIENDAFARAMAKLNGQ